MAEGFCYWSAAERIRPSQRYLKYELGIGLKPLLVWTLNNSTPRSTGIQPAGLSAMGSLGV